ncbi:hypothetical protein P7C70_g9424, partial [Phenoliferia sp. Uapishka_3]
MVGPSFGQSNAPRPRCPDSDTAVTGGWATDVFSQVYHDPTPAKAVLTLAGFKVDDDYVVPRINIDVPTRFTDLIHPFLGPVETLEGLSRGTAILRQTLRGERRQVIIGYASIRQVCKDSVVFKKSHLFKGTKGKDLLDWCDEVYPQLVAEATKAAFSTDRVYKQVADKQIRSIYRHQGAQISHMQESLEVLKSRTALFSPSKMSAKMSAPILSSFTAAASFVLPSAGGSASKSAISLVNAPSAAQNIIRNAPSIFSNPPPSSPPPCASQPSSVPPFPSTPPPQHPSTTPSTTPLHSPQVSDPPSPFVHRSTPLQRQSTPLNADASSAARRAFLTTSPCLIVIPNRESTYDFMALWWVGN